MSTESPGRPGRPSRLVLVVGTGTEVGKTWVSARLLRGLRQASNTVAARKPAQSFDPADDPAGFDSVVLGAASGEGSGEVCLLHRCYERPMAPPMSAESLGRPSFTVADLMDEMVWPIPVVDVGLVESAGGVRSPQADDGDAVTLAHALAPDLVLLVADAGLGTINNVRLCVDVLSPDFATIVVLNRYDDSVELHRRNREWLAERDGFTVCTMPNDESRLVEVIGRDTPAL